MKRTIAFLLSFVMLLGLLSGCGDTADQPQTESTTTTAEAVTTTTTTAATTQGEETTTTAGDTTATTEGSTTAPTQNAATTTSTTTAATKAMVKAKLNGVSLSAYTIVKADLSSDYADRAAELSASDNNFRRIYKRLYPQSPI